MLKYFSRITLLLIAIITISFDVASVTPRGTPKPNLVNFLSENVGWQVCKVVEVKACVDCNKIPITTYKLSSECDKQKTTFITASLIYENSNLLITNPHAEHLLIQEHSSSDVNIFPEITIHQDDLGNLSSAFRVVSIIENQKKNSYALISSVWSMDTIDPNTYGAIYKNLDIRLSCGLSECPPDQVNFFIISIEELNKLRMAHNSP